jgi:hypothetical protein
MPYNYNVDYTKKPSITTLRAAIKKAVGRGADSIFLVWGENVIAIEYDANRDKWSGNGWIGRNGGFDLANELNIQAAFDRQMGNPVQFMRDHFQIIHIK